MSITFEVAIVQNELGALSVSVARGIITGNFQSFFVRISFIFYIS